MLIVEIATPDCEEGEAYCYEFPLDTSWNDIQTAIRLMYPEMTSVWIGWKE